LSGCESAEAPGMTVRNKYLRCVRVLERDFRAVVRCFAHDLPALTAAKMCGVNKNTTHRLYGLLRQRVVALAQAEAKPFVGGIVEVDESYFGPRRVCGKRGRGAGRKIPVIGLLKRADKGFVQIVPNCSKTELLRGFTARSKARDHPHRRLEGL
jgi:transposase